MAHEADEVRIYQSQRLASHLSFGQIFFPTFRRLPTLELLNLYWTLSFTAIFLGDSRGASIIIAKNAFVLQDLVNLRHWIAFNTEKLHIQQGGWQYLSQSHSLEVI